MRSELECPYCGAKAPLKSSECVYGGRDYGLMYICENYPSCDAYVGVHKSSNKPLGHLASKELREWKVKAHAAFDGLWKRKLAQRRAGKPGKSGLPGDASYKQIYARSAGYKWLAEQMQLTAKECHIGMFTVEQCMKVVAICEPYNKKTK